MILLLACATSTAPVAEAPQAPAAGMPDLVILAVSGVRNDPETRAGARFLQPFQSPRAINYSNAYAVTPNAFVSLATVLSGRYPTATPICGLTAAPGPLPADAPWCNHWPEVSPSLPHVLGLYGYRTGLVTANVHGADELGRQFQEATAVQSTWTDVRTDWPALTTAARAFWDKDSSAPRLLVVVTTDLDVRARPDLVAAMGLGSTDGGAMHDPRTIGTVYGQAAEEAGKSMHTLYAALSEAPNRPRVAAVMGLNGVNLGESPAPWQALREGSWNDILLDRTVHVPLMLLTPDQGRRDEAQIVELTDILPTFLSRTNAVLPAGLHSQDLLAQGFTADANATAYSEFGDMLAVRQGTLFWSGRAFFHNRSSLDPELTDFFVKYTDGDQRFHLNDVATDPFQRQEMLSQRLADGRRMNTLLLSIRTGAGKAPETAMDARKIWDLRMSPAAGYW